jgi:hypothetical protein
MGRINSLQHDYQNIDIRLGQIEKKELTKDWRE